MVIVSQCGNIVTDTNLVFLVVEECAIVARHPQATACLVLGRYTTENDAQQALIQALRKSQVNGGYIQL